MTNDRAVKWAGSIMIMVSIGLVVSVCYVLLHNTWFWIASESTEGEVIGSQENARLAGSAYNRDIPAHYSLVRFEDLSGTEIIFGEDVGGENPLYERGEKVTVLYLSKSPEDARIRDFMALYLGPLLLIPFAGIFMFFGLLVKDVSNPRKPDQ